MSPAKVPETAEEAMQAVAKALGWPHETCKGPTCSATIYWALSKNGKMCPIDASCGLSHFATCPDAHQFRKR